MSKNRFLSNGYFFATHMYKSNAITQLFVRQVSLLYNLRFLLVILVLFCQVFVMLNVAKHVIRSVFKYVGKGQLGFWFIALKTTFKHNVFMEYK